MTTNPLTQLTELHALHAEWANAWLPEWWPEMVHKGIYQDGVWVDDPSRWFYCSPYSSAMGTEMDPADALTLVVAAGEKALRGRQWTFHTPGSKGDVGYQTPDDEHIREYDSLADALRAVMSNYK